MRKPKVLVSACLLGVNCRYNGEGALMPEVRTLMDCAELIPVCPEILGGLPTPRPPAERGEDRVRTCVGGDVTEAYARGAAATLHLARLFGARFALMKERSPSCGAGEIYDGSFQHIRVAGNGVAAEALMENGVRVYGESRVRELLDALRKEEEK